MDATTLGPSLVLAGKKAADPTVIAQAVDAWLDDHPEATTTVQDGSISEAKLDNNLKGVVADVGDLKTAIDDLEDAIANKANVDGSYPDMTVGNAEQLVATIGIEDSVPYNFRTAGGSADIGDREVDKIVGGTVAWNQLSPNSKLFQDDYVKSGLTFTPNSDGSITGQGTAVITSEGDMNMYCASDIAVIQGHAYLVAGVSPHFGVSYYSALVAVHNYNSPGVIAKASSTGNATLYLRGNLANGDVINETIKPQIFDLTQMFGSTIADYIYSLEQATAGAGVAWFRKLFPAPYYAYNAGQLMSVQTSAHKMVGFNAWDEEWELGGISSSTGENSSETDRFRSVNYISVNPSTTYYFNDTANHRIFYYDANKTFLSASGVYGYADLFVTPSNCAYIRFFSAGTTYNHDICINLSWDGERDGEYEPYQAWEYPLDSDLTLRGIPKLDADNNLYYDGDTYESDGTVTRRYGVVDLGTLDWKVSVGGSNTAYTVGDTLPALYDSASPRWLCNTYKSVAFSTASSLGDMYVWIDSSYRVRVKDTSKNELTDAAFKAAMSGVYLVYELATPTAETADPYQSPQIVEDFGTEEYIDTRAVAIPVGHDTTYRANLRAKLEMSPNSPDGDGDYIVRQANGQNEYVPLVESVSDVKVNGTSIVSHGVANVPVAQSGELGVVKVQRYGYNGISVESDGEIRTVLASDNSIKDATGSYGMIGPNKQHLSTFYGLAKAAGADMASVSGATVGTYPEAQKSAISQMLSGSVAITGTTPSITALPGIRYVCGECATLAITLPASGIVDVVFASGSTPTVLTVTPPSGVTAVKWANGFDPTSLDANTTYEINVMDGEYGVVGAWT